MSGRGPAYSVVVALHDDASEVRSIYSTVVDALGGLGEPFEIILVDNGLGEDARAAVGERCDADDRVVLVTLCGSLGAQTALRAGLDFVSGEIVVTLDGAIDGPHVAAIPVLVEKVRSGVDLVAGVRGASGRETSTFLALRRSVVREISFSRQMFRFLPVLATWTGASVESVRVDFASSDRATSRVPVRYALDLLFARVLLGLTTRPLRVLGRVGLGALGAAVLCGAGVLLPSVPWHGTLLLGTVLFVVAGVQSFALGLVGELLARMYDDATCGRRYAILGVRQAARGSNTNVCEPRIDQSYESASTGSMFAARSAG